MPIGQLYNESINAEDVDFEIRLLGGAADRTFDQIVTYINVAPAGVNGDFNDDGKVDAADYVVWRKLQGTSTTLPNDNGIGGVVGTQHYNLWRTNFGRVGGSGGQAAVPEPTIVVLLSSGLLAVLPRARRVS